MSRVREFSDLRQSRSSRKDNLNSTFSSRQLLTPKPNRVQFETPKSEVSKQSSAHSHSHYICMNCMNKSMTDRKRCHQKQMQKLERSRVVQQQQSSRQFMDRLADSKQKEHAIQRKKLLDENLKMIQKKRQEKENEKHLKQSQRIKQEERLRQIHRQNEQASKSREFHKNKFRTELQNQIEHKKQKLLKQQLQSRYNQAPIQDNTYLYEYMKQKKDKYKQELEDQIKSNQQIRNQQLKESKINPEDVYYAQWEAENLKKLGQVQDERKRKMKEELNRVRKKEEDRKRQRQEKLRQDMMQMMIQNEFDEKLRKDSQRINFARVNKHKNDIMNQIRENQLRRSKQKADSKWIIQNTQQQPIDTRLCDSCEKEYPKKYLTKV